MNGAESLVTTLVEQSVDICFANPGTSEMHFLNALENPRMRSVLCLFEGVATGAADGYFRMRRKPASTLLHLGPGLANGLANIHNARRAGSAMVNIVGEHATRHLQYHQRRRRRGADPAERQRGHSADDPRRPATADVRPVPHARTEDLHRVMQGHQRAGDHRRQRQLHDHDAIQRRRHEDDDRAERSLHEA